MGLAIALACDVVALMILERPNLGNVTNHQLIRTARLPAAELLVRMAWGKPTKTINQCYFERAVRPRSLPPLDLAAARLVVTDEDRVSRSGWPDATCPLARSRRR